MSNTNAPNNPNEEAPDPNTLFNELGELGKQLNEAINGKDKQLVEVMTGINANPKNVAAAIRALKRLLPDKKKKQKKEKEEKDTSEDAFRDFYQYKLKSGISDYRARVAAGQGKFFHHQEQLNRDFTDNPFVEIEKIRTQFEAKLRERQPSQAPLVAVEFVQGFKEKYKTLEHLIGDANRMSLYNMLYQGMILSCCRIWSVVNIPSWTMFHKEVVQKYIDLHMSYDTMRERIKLYQICQEYPVVIQSGVSPSELAKYSIRLKKFLEERPAEHAFMKGNIDAQGNVVIDWNGAHFAFGSVATSYRADVAEFDIDAKPKTAKQKRKLSFTLL